MEFKGEKAELAKELHDYFRDKIVNGEYEITDKDKYNWCILIDGSFTFCLWIANEDYAFRTYSGDESKPNFMEINLRQKDILKAWNKIKKAVQSEELEVHKEKRRKEYQKLKSEFE